MDGYLQVYGEASRAVPASALVACKRLHVQFWRPMCSRAIIYCPNDPKATDVERLEDRQVYIVALPNSGAKEKKTQD